MRPEPLAFRREEEKDLVWACSFERAKQIAKKIYAAYGYDFFSVDSGSESGLYVLEGPSDEKLADLKGYARAMDEVLSKLLES
mgnify:CR=1 FL=1